MPSSQELKNANKLMRLGKLDRAIAGYNRAIKFNPYLAWSYYYLGEVLVKKGQLQEAVNIYYYALSFNSNLAWCCHSLGVTLCKIEQLEQGIEYLRKAISIDPTFYEFHYSLGWALIQQNTFDKAISCLKKSIELNPKFAYSYKSLGDVLLKTKKWGEATIFFEKAFELKPQLLDKDLSSFVLALQKQGLFDKLIALYHQVIEINPERATELPIIFLKNLGELTDNITYSESRNHKISYIDIPLQNQSQVKQTTTIHQTIHPQFITPQANAKNFVVIVPQGIVWHNDSWGVVVTNSENEILIKRMFRKPNITDLASTKNLPPILNLDGIVVFLSSRWGYNYYHWMFDVISRLELLLNSGLDLNYVDKFIVNSYQKQFQKEILNILGIPQTKIIESDRYHHIKSDRLIVPSLPLAVPLKWNCEFLKRKLMPLKDIVKSGEHPERIYISRQDSEVRRLVNEDEVIAFLSILGFKTVSFSSLSVAEQVSLLANVKVVITVHGAGLTNIVFCQPGTKIIELFGPDIVRNCYYIIANHCNLEHYYMIGESSSTRHDLPKNRGLDVVINLDLLSQLMKLAGIN
ncbi:glycosyltransferase 61 family protein [Dapis sp. BLCC M126]|uniref:glycosyltransferase 61 family protein n=1 Tax=Dapis sp. BLCC M126 TaxID=3400189 RepID=UPI003CEAE392